MKQPFDRRLRITPLSGPLTKPFTTLRIPSIQANHHQSPR